MIKTRAAPAAFAILILTACGGGDPLEEQLQSDIRQAEAESTYDFREGFVSRWEYSGAPKFASCVVLGFRHFRNAKIFPHGGTAVSIGLGDDFRTQAEWREYCSNPMSGADGAPIPKSGSAT